MTTWCLRTRPVVKPRLLSASLMTPSGMTSTGSSCKNTWSSLLFRYLDRSLSNIGVKKSVLIQWLYVSKCSKLLCWICIWLRCIMRLQNLAFNILLDLNVEYWMTVYVGKSCLFYLLKVWNRNSWFFKQQKHKKVKIQ